jgi:hypothetical protein
MGLEERFFGRLRGLRRRSIGWRGFFWRFRRRRWRGFQAEFGFKAAQRVFGLKAFHLLFYLELRGIYGVQR